MLGKERVYTNKALQSIYSMQAKGNSNPHYQDWTTNHFTWTSNTQLTASSRTWHTVS